MTDPHFSNVVTLLHFEGTNGTQAFTDSSNSNHTWTARAAGDQIDTSQSKFGSSSLAVSEGVSIGNIPDFDFGFGDFTWECWHRANSIPQYAYLFSSASGRGDVGCNVEYGTGRNGGWIVSIHNQEGLIGGPAAIGTLDQGVGSNPTPGVWHHVALTRASGVLRLFLDGVEIGSDGGERSLETFSNTNDFAVGDLGDISRGSSPVNGHIDDVRITKGVARYTANFTPATTVLPETGPDPEQAVGQFAHGQCRLVLDGTDLKLSQFNGKWLIVEGVSREIPSAGVTLASTGLTASTTYFVYAYMDGATLTLEASTTGHAIDASSGVEIKSGDASRTLVGMARTNGSAQFVDAQSQRFVRSWFNDSVFCKDEYATMSTTSGAFASVAGLRIEALCWDEERALNDLEGSLDSSVATLLAEGRWKVTDPSSNVHYSTRTMSFYLDQGTGCAWPHQYYHQLDQDGLWVFEYEVRRPAGSGTVNFYAGSAHLRLT